jgi:D-psicose/D-tagatose/L-ribulose 3-epimerase
MEMQRMKWGAHAFLWTETLDTAGILALLPRVADLGLDYLELPIGDDWPVDGKAVGRHARELGLGLVIGPGGNWPMACDLSLPEAADRERAWAWHERALHLAADMGAVAYTGALYSHPGHVLRGPLPADEWPRVVAAMHRLGARAASLGVQVALEPMSRFRTHLINTPSQLMGLLRAADHPNLYALFDTYHALAEVNSFPAALTELMPRLWGLHACENTRGVPGSGYLPWSAIAATLQAANWQGYLAFETYNTAIRGGIFARERGIFQDLCPDGDAFFRQGRAYLEPLLR